MNVFWRDMDETASGPGFYPSQGAFIRQEGCRGIVPGQVVECIFQKIRISVCQFGEFGRRFHDMADVVVEDRNISGGLISDVYDMSLLHQSG